MRFLGPLTLFFGDPTSRRFPDRASAAASIQDDDLSDHQLSGSVCVPGMQLQVFLGSAAGGQDIRDMSILR